MTFNLKATIIPAFAIVATALLSSSAWAALTLTATESGGVINLVGTCTPGAGGIKLWARRTAGGAGPTSWIVLVNDPSPGCATTATRSQNCADPQWGTGTYKFKGKQGTAIVTAGPVNCP
jgi:hypothetical protein